MHHNIVLFFILNIHIKMLISRQKKSDKNIVVSILQEYKSYRFRLVAINLLFHSNWPRICYCTIFKFRKKSDDTNWLMSTISCASFQSIDSLHLIFIICMHKHNIIDNKSISWMSNPWDMKIMNWHCRHFQS